MLDEILVADGALTSKRYNVLLIFQADIVEQPILDRFEKFLRSGGTVIQIGDSQIRNIEGKVWSPRSPVRHVQGVENSKAWLEELAPRLAGLKGVDGKLDGLWTCRRGCQLFVFNSKDNPIQTSEAGRTMKIEPYTIWSSDWSD